VDPDDYGRLAEPIDLSGCVDPLHPDPVELLPQARRIARSVDPQAALVDVSAQVSGGGAVDVSKEARFRSLWLLSKRGRQGPHGQTVTAPCILVVTYEGRLVVWSWESWGGPPRWFIDDGNLPDPAPDPRCSGRDAWKAAIQSGVPESADVQLWYTAAYPRGKGRPYVWEVGVNGAPKQRRTIDATTCQPFAERR
jgi:hypothetical protein